MTQAEANMEQQLHRYEMKWKLLRELYDRWIAAKKKRTDTLQDYRKRIRDQQAAIDTMCRNDRPDQPEHHCRQLAKLMRQKDKLEEQHANAQNLHNSIVSKHERAFGDELDSDQLPLFTDTADRIVAEAMIDDSPIAIGMEVVLDGFPMTVVGIRDVNGQEKIVCRSHDSETEITAEPRLLELPKRDGPTIEMPTADEAAPKKKRGRKKKG